MFLLGFPLPTSVFEIFDLYLLILIASGMGFNVGLIGGEVIKMNHFGQMTCLFLLAIRNGNWQEWINLLCWRDHDSKSGSEWNHIHCLGFQRPDFCQTFDLWHQHAYQPGIPGAVFLPRVLIGCTQMSTQLNCIYPILRGSGVIKLFHLNESRELIKSYFLL